jgi:hypothetical protein
MAVAVQTTDGQLRSADTIVSTIKKRIEQAQTARKPLEPTWLSNLAFAAGQMWLVWDDRAGQLVERRKVDSAYKDRDLFTANRIREYLNAQMGELTSGDDRPQLTAAQQGDEAEGVADHLNQACQHAWTHEWNADTALRRARGYTLTMGVSAIRVRRDKSHGKVVGHAVYGTDGNRSPTRSISRSSSRPASCPDGSLPKFQPVNEGRTCWEPLTFFHVLMQPGITHEDDAAWFDIVRPYPIDDLVDEYGDAARGSRRTATSRPPPDMAAPTSPSPVRTTGAFARPRLAVHVLREAVQPLPARPRHRARVEQLPLLDVQEQLDYQLPDGHRTPASCSSTGTASTTGSTAQAFIEPLKDPQRTINELKTAQLEIMWRGMPKVFTKEGDLINNPTGLPLENIELNRRTRRSRRSSPGSARARGWTQMIADCDNDLSHASTLSALKLGENPAERRHVQPARVCCSSRRGTSGRRSSVTTSSRSGRS